VVARRTQRGIQGLSGVVIREENRLPPITG
jgi:hypothetical protein